MITLKFEFSFVKDFVLKMLYNFFLKLKHKVGFNKASLGTIRIAVSRRVVHSYPVLWDNLQRNPFALNGHVCSLCRGIWVWRWEHANTVFSLESEDFSHLRSFRSYTENPESLTKHRRLHFINLLPFLYTSSGRCIPSSPLVSVQHWASPRQRT